MTLVQGLEILLQGLGELRLRQRSREDDELLLEVVGPDVHVALFQQIVQMLFVTADGRIGLLQLAVVLLLLKIHLTLGRYVACCKNIVNQPVAVINDWHDAQLDVLVDALFREFHVLANMERLSAIQPKVILQKWIVSYQALTEELLAYHVETTQFTHLLIDIDKPPAGIVERHGHQASLENLLVV